MHIVNERPPNWDELVATFHVEQRPKVIFAWGDTIYNPSAIKIPPELMDHEMVHGHRQIKAGVTQWWDKYIKDPVFRLQEELPAHMAEHEAYCRWHTERNAKARHLVTVALKLAGPLYGNLLSANDAMRAIKTGVLP